MVLRRTRFRLFDRQRTPFEVKIAQIERYELASTDCSFTRVTAQILRRALVRARLRNIILIAFLHFSG